MNAFEFAMAGAPESPGFSFPSERFTIGSGPAVGLRFDGRLVQAEHAEVALDAKGVPWIRDLTKQGQLWVNGTQTAKAPLAVGSLVRLGKLELEVRNAEVKLDVTAKRPTPFATPPIEATAKRPTPFQPPPPVRPSGSGRALSGSRHPAMTKDAPRLTPDDLPQLTGEQPKLTRDERSYSSAGEIGEEPTIGRTVLPEGSLIQNRYRIIKKLAAGGMGEVYQAEHVELHKQFAVKVMLPALSADPEFVNRFKREAISASRIGQQNIIDISDFGQTDDGRFYFVMEFLDGMTIASLLHRQGALPVQRMVNIGLQTARALAAAHAQGIVHRDMKPENVMVLQRPGQPDFVKVLDFGVAKVSTGPGQGGQTQLGMVVGTPQYMSPEQAMGVVVDTRTDTYALGLIFYEMLSGAPTFSGDTASILMVKQVTEPAPPFSQELAGSVPAALHDLIFTMLEKDPNARPPSLDKVVQTLETLEAHLKVGAKLPPATASGRFPATATPAALSPVRVTSSGLPLAQPRATVANTGVGSVTADEPLPEVPRSKAPLIALALVLIAGIAVGGVVLLKGDDPKPKPDPEVVVKPPEPPKIDPVPTVPTEPKIEAPKLVEFVLDTRPSGAEVFEDEVSLGITPLKLNRKPESVMNLKFALKGYQDLSKKIAVPEAGTQRPPIELEKKRGGTGPGPSKPPSGPGPEIKDPYAQPEDLKDPYSN